MDACPTDHPQCHDIELWSVCGVHPWTFTSARHWPPKKNRQCAASNRMHFVPRNALFTEAHFHPSLPTAQERTAASFIMSGPDFARRSPTPVSLLSNGKPLLNRRTMFVLHRAVTAQSTWWYNTLKCPILVKTASPWRSSSSLHNHSHNRFVKGFETTCLALHSTWLVKSCQECKARPVVSKPYTNLQKFRELISK